MIKGIIFDWSGTLVDDNLCMYKSNIELFKLYNIPIETIKEYYNKFEIVSWKDIYYKRGVKKLLPNHGELFKKGVEKYFDSIIPYEDTKFILKELKKRNIKVGVVSATPLKNIVKVCEKFDLNNLISSIITEDNSGFKKPSIDLNYSIFSKLKILNDEALFVGDMKMDYEQAKLNNIKFIQKLNDYNKNQQIPNVQKINNLSEILEMI